MDKATEQGQGAWRGKVDKPHCEAVLPDPSPGSIFTSLPGSPSRIHQLEDVIRCGEAETEPFLLQTHSIEIEKERQLQPDRWTTCRNLILTQGRNFFLMEQEMMTSMVSH